MGTRRWRRVSGMVEVALELDRATRAAYLESLDRQRPELRRQILDILRYLGAICFEDAETRSEECSLIRDLEDRIGPYRLVRLLGRGGMGAVFLAERFDHAYERQVAIKVVGSGSEPPIVYQRFLSERQILAFFDHPNIARLYDGGTSRDGRPYLVMEYVEGEPIDRYCFTQALSLRRRLELFYKVCSAVSYAHRNLVVHRDLKPSNILVTDAGEPKLLDFGIAKLLDPASFPVEMEATRTSFQPMTMNWASPEQLRGDPVTPRTDVYALGTLLYRLLTGRMPFGRRDTVADALDALEAVTKTPTRPSRVVSRPPEVGGSELEAWPGEQSSHLRRLLDGNLDAIVLKALRADPALRYQTVASLMEDLERHQAGKPVSAVPESRWQRATRWLRWGRRPVPGSGLRVSLLR